jgi:hypothetical protein
MGKQLSIESFLRETISKRVVTKVRRIVRRVSRFISNNQLELNFTVRPDGLYKTFKRRNKLTGRWEEHYEPITFGKASVKGVGPGNNHHHMDLVLVNSLDLQKRKL